MLATSCRLQQLSFLLPCGCCCSLPLPVHARTPTASRPINPPTHPSAAQTVHYLDNIADLPTLINILCAFMDVQHLDRYALGSGQQVWPRQAGGPAPGQTDGVPFIRNICVSYWMCSI